jgi:hypothetical protein
MKEEFSFDFLKKITELFLTALGLVAALAWNEAIQSLVKYFFPQNEGLLIKFLYAVLLTGVLVLVSWRLNKLMKKFKKSEIKDSEVK